MYGKTHSEETKQKMSENRSGKNHPLYGKSHSEEAKRKMSESTAGENHPLYGESLPEETKEKISKANRGKKFSEEHKKKLSEAMTGQDGLSGRDNPMYGKTHSDETKKKISEKLSGEKHPNYGKPLPEKQKKKLSEAMTGRLTGEDNPMFGKIAYPDPYYVEALGHKVRSAWEEEIGCLLQANSIDYGYEAKTFRMENHTYTPDFIIAENLVVEVKGHFPDYQKDKYKKFVQEFPKVTFIIVGNNDGEDETCDVHIPWEERNALISILENHLND